MAAVAAATVVVAREPQIHPVSHRPEAMTMTAGLRRSAATSGERSSEMFSASRTTPRSTPWGDGRSWSGGECVVAVHPVCAHVCVRVCERACWCQPTCTCTHTRADCERQMTWPHSWLCRCHFGHSIRAQTERGIAACRWARTQGEGVSNMGRFMHSPLQTKSAVRATLSGHPLQSPLHR